MVIVSGSKVQDQSKAEYVITRYIGAGGFGTVYEAQRVSDQSLWAVKTLQTPFADPTTVKAFVNEGTLATTITHKNVIRYSFFHDGSTYPGLPPYIIMEYADGGTLAQLIESKAAQKQFLSNQELLAMFSQLIDGMKAINDSLVHRDIKPDNILFGAGTLKISDFGLSKIVTEATRTTTFKGVGCLPYMAPEAWRLETNTMLMDVYSMGIVFFQLATLTHPLVVSKGDITSWQNAHFFQNPLKPSDSNKALSPVISQTILKMIEKKPQQRFQSWAEVKHFLSKDNIPTSSQSDLVDSVLKRRIEIDEKNKAEQLALEKRHQEIHHQEQLLLYQLTNELIEPIRNFLNQINSKYAGPKNEVELRQETFSATISTSSRRVLGIRMRLIREEDFHRERTVDDYGRKIRISELRIPTLQGQRILAWGFLRAEDNRGFNLLLLENKESPYGIWRLLVNRSNAIAREQRVPPFAFDFDEIEKELHHLGAMHIYVSEVKEFDIQYICKFIAEYI